MASLLDAIDVKRKMFVEIDGVPYVCMESDVSTPSARGAQTLVRLKLRNLLTQAVFDKSYKASEKFKEPDLDDVDASYLYSDGDGAHFMDQQTFETVSLSEDKLGDALQFLVEGAIVQMRKFNGNPIGIELPTHVELTVTDTEPGVKGDSSQGTVTKPATLETGLQIRVPLFIKTGERVRVSTETKQFDGRA